MTDLTLFNYRLSDPDTSRTAAEDNAPRAPRHRDLALATLRRFPQGLTDFELAETTGIAQTSIGKRRHELMRAGLVVNTGRRRPSPSGSPAIVWAVSPLDAEVATPPATDPQRMHVPRAVAPRPGGQPNDRQGEHP